MSHRRHFVEILKFGNSATFKLSIIFLLDWTRAKF